MNAWGLRVVQQLRDWGLDGGLFAAFAGAVYCEPLASYLNLERPLKGLRIGQQLAKLSRREVVTL